MATNYKERGDTVLFIADGAIASGEGVAIGGIVGVAVNDVADEAQGVAAIQGVWTFAKNSSDVIGQGTQVAFKTSTGKMVPTSAVAGDISACGVAHADAGNGATEVQVLLTPGTGSVNS